jgi:hypothetical protein
MRLPFTQHLCFNTQAPALAGHAHLQQFAIAAPGCGTRPFDGQGRLPATFVHAVLHSQPKIAKLVYLCGILQLFTQFLRKLAFKSFILCRLKTPSVVPRRSDSW